MRMAGRTRAPQVPRRTSVSDAVPIRLELKRIIINEIDDDQVIVLNEVDGDRSLPIVIGLF